MEPGDAILLCSLKKLVHGARFFVNSRDIFTRSIATGF